MRNTNEMILENFAGVEHDFQQSTDADHGRIETRRVWVMAEGIEQWLKVAGAWPGIRSVAVVETVRDVPLEGISVQRRYYISSLVRPSAEHIAAAVRGHWSVENGLHHVLDVSFREDDSRLRRIGLNLLKQKGGRFTKRASIRGRRKIAGWDHQYRYLVNLIAG